MSVQQVHIDAGKEDCYHQYVQPGATFYVSFSVSASVDVKDEESVLIFFYS